MAIVITDTMKKTWAYLTKYMTPDGAAAVMGNMYAESGIIPNRVETLCLQRLREHGKIYTDATYTAFVDDGTISKAEFLNPLPGKQYGYGLCQWTSPSRKAGLYDMAKKDHTSIGDLDTQLKFLIAELKLSYSAVWRVLVNAQDLFAATTCFLIDFECPADSESLKQQRYGYAKELKAALNNGSEETPSEKAAIDRLIAVASNEIGYLEKNNGQELDSKTAGAGSGNYTKYWRDVYPNFQGQAWCACFVSWCFERAFGLETAKKLLKHWPYTYCPTLAAMTTNKTPYRGSVVIFYRNGEYAHTGIVEAVTASSITTIEGNTSGASGVIPNGGGVCRKTYDRSTLSPNTKYFMPDYSIVKVKPVTQMLSEEVKWIGEVKSERVNVRTWAGTSYPKIKTYPQIGKGKRVGVCDAVNASRGTPWYFCKIDGDKGEVFGFVASTHIKPVT